MTDTSLDPAQPIKTRSGRRQAFLARLLVALSIGLMIAAVVMSVLQVGEASGTADDPLNLSVVVFVGIVLSNCLVALLILSRYPGHAVGWILLLVGLAAALLMTSGTIVERHDLDPASIASATALEASLLWFGLWVWFPLAVLPIIFIPLFFPTGRLLSRRWRWIAGAATVALLAGIISNAIHPGPFEAIESNARNPLQLAGAAAPADFLWRYVSMPLLQISAYPALAALILRYWRGDRVQRAQLKWVLYVLLMGVLISVALALPSSLSIGSEALQAAFSSFRNPLVQLLAMAIPIVIGMAILRYRLYDIDLIIRRTLVYGVVTALLAAVYFGSVVLLQQFFTGLTGQQSPVAIVISTLVIAALFSSVRSRVQRFINRRFYRQEYDAARTLAQFGSVARQEVDLETLTRSLLQVVDETMQPADLSLWLAPLARGGEAADGKG